MIEDTPAETTEADVRTIAGVDMEETDVVADRRGKRRNGKENGGCQEAEDTNPVGDASWMHARVASGCPDAVVGVDELSEVSVSEVSVVNACIVYTHNCRQ